MGKTAFMATEMPASVRDMGSPWTWTPHAPPWLTTDLDARLEHYRHAQWPGATRGAEFSFVEITWRGNEPWSVAASIRRTPQGRCECTFAEPEPLRPADLFGPGFFSGVVDQINDVLMISEAQPVSFPGPRVVFANAAFERMTGYHREEIIGNTPRMLQGPDTDPTTRARVREHLRSWRSFRERLLNFRRDGTPFLVELDVTPVADETGWFLYWVAVQRDVTEEQRRQDIEAQANRVQTIQALAGGIAHDLNNRLALLSVEIEQLLDTETSAERRREIDTALENLQDTQAITRQFFSLGREPADADTCDVVAALRRSLRLGTKGANIEVHLDLRSSDPLCVAMPTGEFERILLNLLINAQQAAEELGRLRTEVWVTVQRVDREVVIRFRDNGPGIPPELCSRIFDPYHSTKKTGSGLGLAICARAMAEAGGSIVVLPFEPHEGATFELRAPLVDPPEQRRLIADTGPRILVVEDEKRLTRVWASRLERAGFRVRTAESSATARALLVEQTFDLVISDLNLEYRQAGFDVLRDYLQKTPHGHYLIISGCDVRYEAGARGQPLPSKRGEWLPKPFRTEELVDRAKALLAHRPEA